MRDTAVIIVAAGSGTRFGAGMPKQYHDLAGKTILRRTVEVFLSHPNVACIQVVINPDHRDLYEASVQGLNLLPPVAGGATRQASVRAGLEAVAGQNPAYVLIHDAARPLVDHKIITDVRAILATQPAAIAAKQVVDTIKRDEDGLVADTVDRRHLWQAQTPQGFQFGPILAAHRAFAAEDLTDDAAVAEKAGMKVALVAASADNMKVTNPDDLDRVRRLLGVAMDIDIRTGMGIDVHKLVPATEAVLCGVTIPSPLRADGHSDADVALHALTDALLGTIGAGDIGTHFPPSDMQWKGYDSSHFLKHALQLVADKGGRVLNVDITILCERPRISDHRDAMVARLSELLGLSPDRIGLKATTTEELGFAGRKEGIVAQAIATVRIG
jgi:2-C-methyl-D-erythritol 4-phosphate cytidylyltransferase / 2-C-methyl-D-erythritol 2,4-cyclodiphosphate synthase